jgi:DNA invertase Pin-like site-specific DNA recombinase
MKNRVAIYARVSTDKQDTDNQIRSLKKLVEALDLEITHEYVDIMSGGASNRPHFIEMMWAASKHEFDIILVWSLDRFSREGIVNTLSYLKKLKHYNVALKSLQEPWLDTRDEGMGELLIAIIAWVAKQEKDRISQRTKEGLKRAKNVGKRGKDSKPRRRRSDRGIPRIKKGVEK